MKYRILKDNSVDKYIIQKKDFVFWYTVEHDVFGINIFTPRIFSSIEEAEQYIQNEIKHEEEIKIRINNPKYSVIKTIRNK